MNSLGRKRLDVLLEVQKMPRRTVQDWLGTPFTSYIVINQRFSARMVELITFFEGDMVCVNYTYCDALVVRAIIAHNGLKR